MIFVALLAAVLTAVAAVNYTLDPLTFNQAQKEQAGAALASGKNIAIPHSNIDWRDLRREHITRMKTAPDIAIFGGSRWQEAWNGAVPGKTIYNAFVSNDHFEDMAAISELFHSANLMPRALVLSVRFTTFEYLDRRHAGWWKSFAPEYQRMMVKLGEPGRSWWDTLPTEKMQHLFSASAAYTKLTKTTSNEWRPVDGLSDPVMDVVGTDGALRFSEARLRVETPEYAVADSERRAAEDRKKRLKIEPALLVQFDKLLGLLKKDNVNVLILQTPFHPSYFKGIQGSDYFDDLMKIEAATAELARKHNVPMGGSFDANVIGCEPADYRDFNHARVQCLSKILAQAGL